MYITIDTSALIAVIGNEASKKNIVERTAGCSLYAPSSVHWEIGNAFSAMFKRNRTTIDLAIMALAEYREIPINFIDVALDRAVKISNALNIYAYDAYVIQCAQQTSTPLLTLDRGLASAAKQMGIQVLEVTN